MKSESNMELFARSVSSKQGWALNPDADLLSSILSGLSKNKERYGFFLCPCRDSWGDRVKDADIKCPCSYAKKDISDFNRCYCGLFVKKGSVAEDLDIPVPDRRPENLYPE